MEKKANNGVSSLPSTTIKEVNQIAINEVTQCFFAVLRPFHASAGQHHFATAKAYINIGQKLGFLPRDDDIEKMIPNQVQHAKKVDASPLSCHISSDKCDSGK